MLRPGTGFGRGVPRWTRAKSWPVVGEAQPEKASIQAGLPTAAGFGGLETWLQEGLEKASSAPARQRTTRGKRQWVRIE